MTTPTIAHPLIPTELLSAIQALGAVAALSLINTGDRSLNAAIATVLTACMAVLIERIKTFKTLTDVYTLIDTLTSWTSYKTKRLSPTDIDCTKHLPSETKFECSVYICSAAQPHVFAWLKTIPAWKQISGYGRQLCLTQVKEHKFISATELSGYKFKFHIPHRIPIWYCDKTREYVYFSAYRDSLEDIHEIYLSCQRQEPLNDVVAEIEKDIEKKYFYASPNNKMQTIKALNSSGAIILVGKISATKIFDRLFFEQKSQLLDYLHRFKSKTMYANGDENRGGILMHGPAGTGKSSCIAAIANFLGYDVLRVTGTQMRNRTLMNAVFKMTGIVIAFDEMDCLLDVIQRRDTKPITAVAEQSKAELAASILKLAMAENDETKHAALMKRYEDIANSESNKVDLEFFLSKFQGYEYQEDRFIVGCTNNLDLIEPALLRKGRFDMVLELGNATPRMIVDIVANYFKMSDTTELETKFMDRLPVKKLPPVEILHMAASASSAKSVLEQLAIKHESC